MSDSVVKCVWVLQDQSDGKWLPKKRDAAWTDDDLLREEFFDKEDAGKLKCAYGNAVVVSVPMLCRGSEYDEADRASRLSVELSRWVDRLDNLEAVGTVVVALRMYARKLRAGGSGDES